MIKSRAFKYLRSAFMRCQRITYKMRGARLSLWIRLAGGSVGSGLMADKGVHFRHPPSAKWEIGQDVYIGRGTILDIWPGATLAIGDQSKIMHYVVLAARNSIRIGSRAQVADCSTVRDADHGISADQDILSAEMNSDPVTIGNGAWLAWGTATLRGVTVGNGAVVGAGSVVISDLPDNAIAAGSPATVRRQRN